MPRGCLSKALLLKKLNSIENFGSMTVMCSDKTGTITQGKVKLHSSLNFSGENSDELKKFAGLNSYFQEGYANPIDEAILSDKSEDFSAYKKLLKSLTLLKINS